MEGNGSRFGPVLYMGGGMTGERSLKECVNQGATFGVKMFSIPEYENFFYC